MKWPGFPPLFKNAALTTHKCSFLCPAPSSTSLCKTLVASFWE